MLYKTLDSLRQEQPNRGIGVCFPSGLSGFSQEEDLEDKLNFKMLNQV
jgi:hypothetical protein